MTREEAIEIIEFEKCHCETHLNDADKAEEFYNEIRKFIEAFDMAIKALEAPPNDNWEGYSKRLWKSAYERGKADAEQRWIPVSERMPEKAKDVLVTTCRTGYGNEKNYFIETACRYGEIETGIEWVCAHDDIVIDDSEYQVIAWMPLPEPYKAESEDKE